MANIMRPSSSESSTLTALTMALALLHFSHQCLSPCNAFVAPLSRQQQKQPQINIKNSNKNNNMKQTYTNLHGISEWRDQSLESYYSLEAYQKPQPSSTNTPSNAPSKILSPIPSKIPILPFAFPEMLFLGQRTQLNLYESRFHSLFQDVMDNYSGVVAMGLLAGNNGLITTLPLCEVESFSRVGGVDPADYVDKGDGMGNGSIFVTIRAVGRVKIVEGELVKSEPYMVGRVREMMDEEMKTGSSAGSSEELVEGNRLAEEVQEVIESLASLESKLNALEENNSQKKLEGVSKTIGSKSKVEDEDGDNDGDSVMNRRLVNAQLESLFMMDDIENEGVILDEGSSSADMEGMDDDDEDDDDYDDDVMDEDGNNQLDRVGQFQKAIQMAMEADTQGYVTQQTTSSDQSSSSSQQPTQKILKSPKELTAISWAAFCTSPFSSTSSNNGDSYTSESIAQDVFKIQALDMSNVVSRMKLGLAMLKEEEKKCKAKLASKEASKSSSSLEEDDDEIGGVDDSL